MRKTIILFIFLHVLSYAFPIYFKHIGMKEGLSQLSVMSIYQDELGRMWFGTEEGLSVFDGVRVTSHKPTLKSGTDKETTIGNSINFITGDQQGNIYFTSDNALIQYSLHTQEFTCLERSIVTAVAFGGEQLWVGIADSVFIWEPQKKELQFRDEYAKKFGWNLIVESNMEAFHAGVGPFTHGSKVHTDLMKTQALLHALDKYKFDAAFGGARRDEEKSRAKERIYSFRDKFHQWDPKNQRPELWDIYNARVHKGESIRVFPLSNWTELDIWQYIRLENIPIVPLYYAKERPIVELDGNLIMADDDRLPEQYRDQIKMRMVRFRTLGCWPLTGAVDSEADTIEKIVEEMMTTTKSERTTRVIDFDQDASMEQKKREGYF